MGTKAQKADCHDTSLDALAAVSTYDQREL